MVAVTMRARVVQLPEPGGITTLVTDTPDVSAAARRVIGSHEPMVQGECHTRHHLLIEHGAAGAHAHEL